jgi:hypothetical protein
VEGVVEGVSERSDRERCGKSEEGVEIGGQVRKMV